MTHHLAQVNIAKFRLPSDHPTNADFVNALDRVNAIAEGQPGFIWRLTGDANDALDINVFDDPLVAINMSVWADMDALSAFVYRTPAHRDFMRRRAEWFDKVETHLALWWVPAGHIPSAAGGRTKTRLSR